MTDDLVSCVQAMVSGMWRRRSEMWVYGRHLEGGTKTAWVLHTHPRILQCHIAPTHLFSMLSGCHP